VPVGLVFDPILWSIAIHGQQAYYGILAPGLVIDAPIWEELHSLIYTEFVFVLWHIDGLPQTIQKRVGGLAAGITQSLTPQRCST
jgi:hypothetical protein